MADHMLKDFNRPRWAGERGHLEAWYLTCNDRETRHGYWFRIALTAPADRGVRSSARLWFTRFSHEGAATRIISSAYDTAGCVLAPGAIRVGPGGLEPGHMWGAIERDGTSVAWDLRFDEGEEYLHMPRVMYALKLRRSFSASPNLSVKIRGTVTVNGVTCEVGGMATQGHVWGRRLPRQWVWLHANDFEGDAAVIEMATTREPVRRIWTPTFATICVIHGGERRRLWLADPLLFKETVSFPSYSFWAMDHRFRVEGAVSAPLDRFVQYRYPAPAGRDSHCANTEIASLKLTLYGRGGPFSSWRRRAELKAADTAHFEIGSRAPIPGVPVFNPA
ncbi:MAG: hypothetical protein HY897_14285 [Deltaproteobacteria bacterium]|nr:hypothetical protein [Deltaproteobacteria bacterium]